MSFSAGFYAAQARALQVLGFEGISLEGPPLLERKDLHPDVEALIKDLKEKHEAFSSGKPILFVNLLYGYGQWRRKKDTWLLILKKLLAQFPGYIVINEGPPSWNGQTLGHQEIVGVYEKLALVDDQKKLIRIGDIPNLENDLVRLFALMTLADVVLTEHSGVTHLADWMRKPLITSKNPQFSDYLLERPDSLDLQDVEADVPAAVQRLLAEAKPSGLEEAGWSFGPVSPVEEFKQRADKFRSAYIAAKSFMHRSSSGADLTTLLTAIETDIHNVLLDTGAPTYLASEAEEAIALYHLLKREPDRQRREGAAEGTSDKNLSVLLRRLAGKIDLIEDSFISSRFAETLDRRIETLPEDLKFKARKELTRLGANIQRARDFAHDRTELAEGWSPRGAAASFADIRQRLEEFYGETLTVEVGPFALEAILAMPSVRLFSLINNLVANAVGHTPGKEKVSLRLSMDPTTKELKIKVEDKGIGIPAEYFEETPDGMIRLFALEERGWRVPIGMAEVWDILAIADGRIAVETHHISKHPDNHGTTFTLWLPLSEAAPLTPSGAWLPLAPSAPEEAAGGLEEGIGVEAQAAEKLKEAVTAYAA